METDSRVAVQRGHRCLCARASLIGLTEKKVALVEFLLKEFRNCSYRNSLGMDDLLQHAWTKMLANKADKPAKLS